MYGEVQCYLSERRRARIITENKHSPKISLTRIRLFAMYQNISVLIRLLAISKNTYLLIKTISQNQQMLTSF
jgi:hypothetical protein